MNALSEAFSDRQAPCLLLYRIKRQPKQAVLPLLIPGDRMGLYDKVMQRLATIPAPSPFATAVLDKHICWTAYSQGLFDSAIAEVMIEPPPCPSTSTGDLIAPGSNKSILRNHLAKFLNSHKAWWRTDTMHAICNIIGKHVRTSTFARTGASEDQRFCHRSLHVAFDEVSGRPNMHHGEKSKGNPCLAMAKMDFGVCRPQLVSSAPLTSCTLLRWLYSDLRSSLLSLMVLRESMITGTCGWCVMRLFYWANISSRFGGPNCKLDYNDSIGETLPQQTISAVGFSLQMTRFIV